MISIVEQVGISKKVKILDYYYICLFVNVSVTNKLSVCVQCGGTKVSVTNVMKYKTVKYSLINQSGLKY